MKILQRHLSYANVAATLALLFSMSGGALAAKHYLLNNPKQISPGVLKSLASRDTSLFKRLAQSVIVAKASTAGTAGTATHATIADAATYATHSGSADSAGNAATLGGQGPSAFLASSKVASGSAPFSPAQTLLTIPGDIQLETTGEEEHVKFNFTGTGLWEIYAKSAVSGVEGPGSKTLILEGNLTTFMVIKADTNLVWQVQCGHQLFGKGIFCVAVGG